MDKNSWKNEAVSMEVQDIVYYGGSYLAILKFQGKGTTWYIPVPAERSAIDASLKGQKLLRLINK